MSVDTGSIIEHMDIIAADGEKIGKVDHFQGGRIKLTKTIPPTASITLCQSPGSITLTRTCT